MSLNNNVLQIFHNAAEQLFNSWTALQLAVHYGFGGAESDAKGKWFVSATVQWFSENDNLEVYEVEEFLSQLLYNEFDTVLEDGSLMKVSENLCRYYSLCQSGRLSELQSLLASLPSCKNALQQSKVSSTVEDGDELSDDSEDDDLDVEASAGGSNNISCHNHSLAQHNSEGATKRDCEVNSIQNDADTEMQEEDEDEKWTVVHRSKKR